MTYVWSFSGLDTYETCPRKFKHRYILKEKEAYSPALENGNKVHKAIENFMKSDLEDRALTVGYELINAVKRQAKGKKLHIEQKMGLNGIVEPVGFFDDHVWGRGAADVIIVDNPNAVLIDWKTGKVREKPTQLAILALFVFKHFPKVEKITAFNVWLEHNKFGTVYTFTRAHEAALWGAIMPKIQAVENSIAADKFDMKPGPLCRFCSVLSCPNNKS